MTKEELHPGLVRAISTTFQIQPEQVMPEMSQDNFDAWDSLRNLDLITDIEAETGVYFDEDVLRLASSIRERYSVQKLQEALDKQILKNTNTSK